MNKDTDYIEIILTGYRTNKEYLSNYFFRKWKEAEEKHFSQDEFFDGLRNAVKSLNKTLEYEYFNLYSHAISKVGSANVEPIGNFKMPLPSPWRGSINKYDLVDVAKAIGEAQTKEMNLKGYAIIADAVKKIEELQSKLKTEEKKGSEEKKLSLSAKLVLLFLYKKDHKLNKTKHIKIVNEKLNIKETSLENEYRDLTYYINREGLTEGQRKTFDDYNDKLNDPSIIEKLKALGLI